MAKKHLLHMNLNGKDVQIQVAASATLATVLRDGFGLTGTKIGCEEGECGACTVLVDGLPVTSCIYPALKAHGRRVVTIEGLSGTASTDAPPRLEDLHPVQRAFVEHGAIQCGYCTPGLVMAGVALLQQNPNPTEAEIRRAISGNLCRCTGYIKIVEAIQAAARELQAKGKPPTPAGGQ